MLLLSSLVVVVVVVVAVVIAVVVVAIVIVIDAVVVVRYGIILGALRSWMFAQSATPRRRDSKVLFKLPEQRVPIGG